MKEQFLNRGDYYFAAQSMGGFEGARGGIEALHRGGGHIVYYVEGLIVWKRSRVGRAHGQEWAMMNADGTYLEDYKGFFHECPASKEWQEWMAHAIAELVRSTGADGVFIDSLLATKTHRCFNPAHHHPNPDVWNWGVRQLLMRIREELDKVNPEAVILTEGGADIGRESADGFLSHTHWWTDNTFDEPFVRFLYPQMRAFESWSSSDPTPAGKIAGPPEKLLVWNAVNGYRIYAHSPLHEQVASISRGIRHYYDLYPEVTDSPMSRLDVECANCLSQLYDGQTVEVLTVGNLTGSAVRATITLPADAGELFDRADSTRIPVRERKVNLELKPWEFRGFEVRP